MNEVIGLTGYARSGKNTVGTLLEARGYRPMAWADKVREAALALDPIVYVDQGGQPVRLRQALDVWGGWEGVKAPETPDAIRGEVRRTLQRLGTEAGRSVHGPDIWVRSFWKYAPWGEKLVITDVRFPEEADSIIERGGVIIRVNRPGVRPLGGHISETEVDSIYPDAVLVNDDTIELLEKRLDDMLPGLDITMAQRAGRLYRV